VLFDYRKWSEASGAAPSSTNVELAALRRVFRKAAKAGLVDWGKAEAASGVGNSRSSGVRVGNWLTAEQAKALLLAPEEYPPRGNARTIKDYLAHYQVAIGTNPQPIRRLQRVKRCPSSRLLRQDSEW
jgi:hypothetical protein